MYGHTVRLRCFCCCMQYRSLPRGRMRIILPWAKESFAEYDAVFSDSTFFSVLSGMDSTWLHILTFHHCHFGLQLVSPYLVIVSICPT